MISTKKKGIEENIWVSVSVSFNSVEQQSEENIPSLNCSNSASGDLPLIYLMYKSRNENMTAWLIY